MSRTVCSWCKAPLVLKDDVLVCSNTDCPACDEKYLHEALIRTHKALDVAKEGLKEIQDKGEYVNPIDIATSCLDEITALEQKD